jgi:hypothetical protein
MEWSGSYLAPEGRGRRAAAGEGFSAALGQSAFTDTEPLTPPSPLRGEGARARWDGCNRSRKPYAFRGQEGLRR